MSSFPADAEPAQRSERHTGNRHEARAFAPASVGNIGVGFDLLGHDRSRAPLLLASGDLAEETLQDFGAVWRVDNFRMELDAVKLLFGRFKSGKR